MGDSYSGAHQYEKAEENLEVACRVLEEVGDRVGLSLSIKVRGQIAMDRGDLSAAEARFREAHGMLAGLHHNLEEIELILRLGQVELGQGRLADARGHLADLERLRVEEARPDLRGEYDRFRQELSPPEGGHVPS
jgi:ATP/maltotriose-dependent transcriptional regulator MalT